jgi:hypothetical protein
MEGGMGGHAGIFSNMDIALNFQNVLAKRKLW